MADFLTFADIYGQIQNLIDDDDTDVLTVIKQVINNIYREVMGEFRKGRSIPDWLVDYDVALSTTASTRETTITASILVERILKVSVDNQPCLPISVEELEGGAGVVAGNKSPEYWWSTTNTTRPPRFRHSKTYTAAGVETNKFQWFPLPDDTYTIRFWYEKRVSPLSADANVPFLPPFVHQILVVGSLVQLPMFDIRVRTGPWDSIYASLLSQLRGFTNNFVIDGHTVPFGL